MSKPPALIPVRVGNGKAVHLGMLTSKHTAAAPSYGADCIPNGARAAGRAVAERITCRNCIRDAGLIIDLAHQNAGI